MQRNWKLQKGLKFLENKSLSNSVTKELYKEIVAFNITFKKISFLFQIMLQRIDQLDNTIEILWQGYLPIEKKKVLSQTQWREQWSTLSEENYL